MYVLRLYVLGQGPRSQRAIRALKDICERSRGADFDVEVIDIAANPQLAEEHRVLATPMLVKLAPEPVKRLIGELSDEGKVLLALDLEDRSAVRQP
jgi:circadian clock protein KaiB